MPSAKDILGLVTSPVYWRCMVEDLLQRPEQNNLAMDHLSAAISWLYAGFQARGNTGVPIHYAPVWREPWAAPYLETTGYIVETFVWYGLLFGSTVHLDAARLMVEWLMKSQLGNGAFPSNVTRRRIVNKPIVFDTAQVLLGLCAFHKLSGSQDVLEAARRAGWWLVSQQEPSGEWQKYTFRGSGRAYHARVAWPLLELARLTGDDSFSSASHAGLRWILRLRHSDGWFERCGFSDIQPAYLHTIAYVLEGFLHSYRLTLKEEYWAAAHTIARNLLADFETRGRLAGEYGPGWRGLYSYRCLTGEAQVVCSWFLIYSLTNEKRYCTAARSLLEALERVHRLPRNPSQLGWRGGLAGSFPFWGRYMPFVFPNWATKFLADALMCSYLLESGYGWPLVYGIL